MLGMIYPSVSGVATAKFREGFREGDCASQISRRVGADVVSAIADRVKFRRKARWTQILYRKANGGAQEKSHPRIEDEPVGSDPAPSQGGNPRLEEPHNLVERVFGSKVTGAGGDAIPLR